MRERGFTLVELLIGIIVLGILAVVLTPYFSAVRTAQLQAYTEKQRLINQRIASGLVRYASEHSTTGALPAPYTATGVNSGPIDTTDGDLTAIMQETGIDPGEFNDDGRSSPRVRVYQRAAVTGYETPLFVRSGPLVLLDYHIGAVYITDCIKGTACDADIPGASAELTAANRATWNITAPDSAVARLSSLPVQKRMMALTASRMNAIRDALTGYATAKILAAAPGDTTNHYPGSGMSGLDPLVAANQGCRDGWYPLNDASVNVLPLVGLTKSEYGVTAWGGAIQYCRDYDPSGSLGAGTPPHYAAIRVNRGLSTAAGPTATPGDNIVLSF